MIGYGILLWRRNYVTEWCTGSFFGPGAERIIGSLQSRQAFVKILPKTLVNTNAYRSFLKPSLKKALIQAKLFSMNQGSFKSLEKLIQESMIFLLMLFCLSDLRGSVTRSFTIRFLSLCCGQRSPTWSM